jgi:glycosyltransferase involved in cell wall biosynthesis
MAHLLARRGWRVHVLYSGSGQGPKALVDVKQRLNQAGIGFTPLDECPVPQLFEVPSTPHSPRDRLGEKVRYALEELHRSHKFDLAEFAEWGGLGFRSIQAKRMGLAFSDLRFLVKLHSSSQWIREGNDHYMGRPDDLERDYSERYAFEYADIQVSPSRYMLGYAQSIGWKVRTDAQILPYPRPDPEFVPAESPKDPTLEVVFFGRLEIPKGLAIFLEAVRQLEPTIPITFLGRDTFLAGGKRASDYIAEQLPGRCFTLLTNYNREQALEYLARGDRLGVIAPLADNCPFTVLECSINGIPFIASRVGGIPEIVTTSEAQASLLFDPTTRDLLRILKSYLNTNPVQRLALRNSLRKTVEVAEHNRQLGEGYDALASRPRPSSPAGPGEGDLPLVTVAIPYFNLGVHLPQTLASLEKQTYPNMEVVVINDGSTDPYSIQVFEEQRQKYPRFRFLSQDNTGIGATRNLGLREAQGEFFIPVDADNVAFPHMVESFVRAIQSNPQLAALSCFYLGFRESGDLTRGDYIYAGRPTGGPRVMASFKNVYGDGNAIFRTELFRAVDGYETDRDTSWEDWEAFIKLVNAGYQVDVVPEYLFAYRHRESGFSRITRVFQNHQRVLRQMFQADQLPAAERIALWTALVSLEKRFDELSEDNHNLHQRLGSLRYRLADRLSGLLGKIPLVGRGVKRLLRSGWQVWKYIRVRFGRRNPAAETITE